MEIAISDWQLICEIERRIETKDIFRSQNGKLWPRYCPVCGGTLTEYGVEVNFTPEEWAKINLGQWIDISKKFTDKEGLYLPTLPYRESGKFFYVRCDNSLRWVNPCKLRNTEWFKDLEKARMDFFNSMTE